MKSVTNTNKWPVWMNKNQINWMTLPLDLTHRTSFMKTTIWCSLCQTPMSPAGWKWKWFSIFLIHRPRPGPTARANSQQPIDTHTVPALWKKSITTPMSKRPWATEKIFLETSDRQMIQKSLKKIIHLSSYKYSGVHTDTHWQPVQQTAALMRAARSCWCSTRAALDMELKHVLKEYEPTQSLYEQAIMKPSGGGLCFPECTSDRLKLSDPSSCWTLILNYSAAVL